MTAQPTIVGAGLAGLLAAHAWTGAEVLEFAPAPRQMHNALLRFRTDAVSQLTGIEFRRVRVHKGIWSAQRFHTTCTIPLANQYTQKVLGRCAGERSIWSLDAVDRFIAPEDFYQQLLANVGSRISWGSQATYNDQRTYISTAPLPATLAAAGIAAPECRRAAITVVRCRVTDADVFQTVYFPDPETPMYRASITGSLLLIEAMNIGVTTREWLPRALVLVQRAFAIDKPAVLDVVDQSYGKIVPLPDEQRKGLLFRLTHEHNIYSLGRFATWRNVLLDEVVHDISVIKKIMHASPYARARDNLAINSERKST